MRKERSKRLWGERIGSNTDRNFGIGGSTNRVGAVEIGPYKISKTWCSRTTLKDKRTIDHLLEVRDASQAIYTARAKLRATGNLKEQRKRLSTETLRVQESKPNYPGNPFPSLPQALSGAKTR